MPLTSHDFRRRITKCRFGRAACLLLVVVLVLQLIGTAFHHHNLAMEEDDCVSCYLAVHVPSHVPPAVSVVLTTMAVFRYQIPLLPLYDFVAAQSYLIPLPLAPPRRFFFA